MRGTARRMHLVLALFAVVCMLPFLFTSGSAKEEAVTGQSRLVIVNINDPFKKWDSLRIRLDFTSEGGSLTRAYEVLSTDRSGNITIEVPYYSGLGFRCYVESYWWMTEYHNLSNDSGNYALLPGEELIFDLMLEIYSNKVKEIALYAKGQLWELAEAGYVPAYSVSRIELLLLEGIEHARAQDYTEALTSYRGLLLAKSRLEDQTRELTSLAPVSFTMLYFHGMLAALLAGGLRLRSGRTVVLFAASAFLAVSATFVFFQPDARHVVSRLIPTNPVLGEVVGLLLLLSSFLLVALLARRLKEVEGLRRFSSIAALAVLNLRRRSFRYALVVLTTALVTAAAIFLSSIAVVHLRIEQEVTVDHRLTVLTAEGGATEILEEDYSWIVSVSHAAEVSPVALDDVSPSLPAAEMQTVKQRGYYYVSNLRDPNLTSAVAFRLCLQAGVSERLYKLSTVLAEGRTPVEMNETLLSQRKASVLKVRIGDSIVFDGYVPHIGYRRLGTYLVVGLFDGEKLAHVRELNGGPLATFGPYQEYGDYTFDDVMLCAWCPQVGIRRFSLVFEQFDLENLGTLANNLALTRLHENLVVWLTSGGVASRISYARSLFVHGIVDLVIPLALSTMLVFTTTLDTTSARAAEHRTLALLGLNPTDLRRLVVMEVAFAQSVAGITGYMLGSVVLPSLVGSYARSGLSYQIIMLSILLLQTFLGAYIPARRATLPITPSRKHAWSPSPGRFRGHGVQRLPIRIPQVFYPSLDMFLRGRLPSGMRTENPALNVEFEGVEPSGQVERFAYRVTYNLMPFRMYVLALRDDGYVAPAVELERPRFVGREYHRPILSALRAEFLRYVLEQKAT